MSARPAVVGIGRATRVCHQAVARWRLRPQLVLVFFVGSLIGMGAFQTEAAEPSAEDKAMLASLDQLCEKARAAERFHIQRRIIKICTDKGRSAEQCEAEAKQYGNLNLGNLSPEADLPVCKQARAFRQAMRGKP